jgi:hypothetical protein
MRTRTIVAFALVVATAVVAEGVVVIHVLDARQAEQVNRAALSVTRRDLESTEGSIAETQQALDSAHHLIGRRTQQASRARKALDGAKAREARAARELAASRLLASRASEGVAAVRTCADGVGSATVESHGGNKAAAALHLVHAQDACTRVLNAEGSTAVYPFDFSDPSVLRVDTMYYAYSTNNAAGDIQVITSTDLHHWTLLGNALANLPGWAASGSTWAPSVIALGGLYAAYYTVREAFSGNQCLSVAFGREPAGPFLDASSGPLVCQRELAGSIDPRPFVDSAGRPWLVWSTIGGKLPALIWSQALTADGRAPTGTPTAILKPDRKWEAGVVEAPSLVDDHGALVLFYAGNRWSTRDYGVGVARCASPAGPCVKDQRSRVYASNRAIVGPGSPDFVTTPSGEVWMAFAAYRAGQVGYPASRLLHVARVHVDRTRVTFTPN